MLRLFCCCCSSADNLSERQPLLQPGSPSEVNPAQTARQAHAIQNAKTEKTGKLEVRRMNVPDLDQTLVDMKETFNLQQKHYEAMLGHIGQLKQSCESTDADDVALAECIGKIRKRQEGKYRVSLTMKGYDFTLKLDPVGPAGQPEVEPLPPSLQSAKNEIRRISDNAKAVMSKASALTQLIDWLLRSHGEMAEQVKGAAGTYQEQRRLNDNLEENMKEVRRAKKLSQRYIQKAQEVQNEALQIALVAV